MLNIPLGQGRPIFVSADTRCVGTESVGAQQVTASKVLTLLAESPELVVALVDSRACKP